MYEKLLATLVCPKCKNAVELTSFENGERSSAAVAEGEVNTGILKCRCGVVYPLLDGVPRFLDGGIRHFPDFFERHRTKLLQSAGIDRLEALPKASGQQDDFENIRRSFSEEWNFFDYENDHTWGWTLEERKRIVLSELRMKPEELVGKRLLDAGCGNGTLSAAMSDLGLEVVGLDLNDGLGNAYRNRVKHSAQAKAHVQYVQGNVVHPPLTEGAFDIVYSSGVIHHTPSSKTAFDTLVRMTKPGGRLFIWVYGKRAWPVRLFWACGESLKSFCSNRAILRACRIIAPFYKAAASVLNALGLMKFRKRTTREVALDLFDGFAPRFNHWHSEEDVRSWFEEHGFKNITLSSQGRHGLGMYGDKV